MEKRKRFSPILLKLIQAVMRIVMRYFSRRIVIGKELIPKKGGILLLANHRSDCDVIFVQLACPRHISFMAKSEIFEMGKVGKFIEFWQAFSVRQGQSDRTAIRHAVDLIKDGRAVCVFPEGETSESAKLLPLKSGIILIAKMAGCCVQCVGVQGTELVLPYSKLKPQKSRQPVTIHFGPILNPADFASPEVLLEAVKNELLRLSNQDPEAAISG